MRPFTAKKEKTFLKNQREQLYSECTQRPSSAIFSLKKITQIIQSKLNLKDKNDKKPFMQKSFNKAESNLINLDKMLGNNKRSKTIKLKTHQNYQNYQTQICKKQQKKVVQPKIKSSKITDNTFQTLFKSESLFKNEVINQISDQYPLKYRSQNIIKEDFVPYNKLEDKGNIHKQQAIQLKLKYNQNDNTQFQYNSKKETEKYASIRKQGHKEVQKKSLRSIQQKQPTQRKQEQITSWETNQSFMKMSKIMEKFTF